MHHRHKRLLLVGSGILFLLLLILYMGGFFATGLIGPGDEAPPAAKAPPPKATAVARVEEVVEYFEAVGTVRSRATARIESQVMARIEAVQVAAGDRVERGDVLVVLDRRQQETKRAQAGEGLTGAIAGEQQAAQGVAAAKAALAQAEAQYRRIQKYVEAEAATEQMREEAESAFRQAAAGLAQAEKAVEQARAGVRQAREQIAEAEIGLDYTRILAPVAGEVAERLADPGDMAVPGKPLLLLQAPEAMRLDALVRESLIGRLQPEATFTVTIDAIGASVAATVEEVMPTADPRSRTFVVKAALPALPGLHPGMFGRLFIPVGLRRTVLVPAGAVRIIGQLQVVRIEQDGVWRNVAVLTGREIDGRVEILSGLAGGETVALEAGGHD